MSNLGLKHAAVLAMLLLLRGCLHCCVASSSSAVLCWQPLHEVGAAQPYRQGCHKPPLSQLKVRPTIVSLSYVPLLVRTLH